MSRTDVDFYQAGNTPLMPTVTQTQNAQSVVGRSSQSSVGACDACRLRKVRCLANESSLSSKCQRCARANRECVYTTHSKTRRRKRTDTRVKELEEKVRGLSMLLENGRGGSGSSAEPDVEGREDEEGSGRRKSEADAATPAIVESCRWKRSVSPLEQSSEFISQKWGISSEHLAPDPTSPDVVERGILSMAKATELVNRYTNLLMPHYPAILLDRSAHELRKTKPTLFLAVLAASVEASDPILYVKLNHEIQQLYAKRIAIQGHKSLELIQALVVSITWTYPPKKFEELKFHQQIHMAATMAQDIGLGRRPRLNRDQSQIPEPDRIRDHGAPEGDFSYKISLARESLARKRLADSSSLEGRRALLACYVLCASVAISLRLPNMLRFTSWMAECVECLETSPEAAPTDKRFAAWVKLQRIVEDCWMSLGLDSPEDSVSLDEERTQLMLKGAERQLTAWRSQAASTPGVLNDFLEISYHANNVYLHEFALHNEPDAEDFRPPFSLTAKILSQKRLSPPYITATMLCISSSQSLIEIFLNMELESASASPTLVWVRLCYAVVILMKLSIAASTSSNELSKVLDPEDCKVLYYTEKAIAYIEKIMILGEKKHGLAIRFLHILTNLKTWFERQTLQLNAEDGQDVILGSNEVASSKQRPEGSRSPMSTSSYNVTAAVTSTAGMTSNHEALSQDSDPSQHPTNADFLHDNSRSLIGQAFDSNPAEVTPAPFTQAHMWANGVQQPPRQQQGPDFSYAPMSNGPFDFPMDVDPNLFSQLVSNELYEYSGGNIMLNGDNALEYTDMADIDWANWPQPL